MFLSPFQFFEFDIKYMWVQPKRSKIQVLTNLDVFSKMNLGQIIAYKIKRKDVINLFEGVMSAFGLPDQSTVRCDNGSQFIALELQNYLQSKGVSQEFTKPITPQQNAHIESHHSIQERAICQRVELTDAEDVGEKIKEYMEALSTPILSIICRKTEWNLVNPARSRSLFVGIPNVARFYKVSSFYRIAQNCKPHIDLHLQIK